MVSLVELHELLVIAALVRVKLLGPAPVKAPEVSTVHLLERLPALAENIDDLLHADHDGGGWVVLPVAVDEITDVLPGEGTGRVVVVEVHDHVTNEVVAEAAAGIHAGP